MLTNPQSDSTAPFPDLNSLLLDCGTVTEVEHCVDPTMTLPNGSMINDLPPRTIVRITLSPAKGSHIHVEVWLPTAENWNSRFLGRGNGGAAGSIPIESLAGPIRSGYATAASDMGTAPNADAGIGNPEVWKDFGFRATHLMTVTAKRCIQACYGRDPEFSYFSGGSTGGQQALQEVQRYPEDYDGVIAGIPAHCRTPLHAYFLWNEQTLAHGVFSESQKSNIIAAANEFMASRELPITAGKMVSDPRCTDKEIEFVIKLAREKDETLTASHGEALRKLFNGPRHATTGEQIFDGIPLGSSFDTAQGHLYLFKWVFGADRNLMTINFGTDIDTYTSALGPYLNAENPDLSAFEKRGGKLLIFSGTADSCVPYHATLDYYERMIELFGSVEKVQFFCRFFLIPGMGHGPGENPTSPGVNAIPDMLDLLVRWRESGVVPEKIEVNRISNGETEWALPIFPYPAKTGWEDDSFVKVKGARRGVGQVAKRFRPEAEM